MNFNDGRMARSESVSGGEKYLDAVVRTASPAKLRLMLIERAVGVSESLEVSWRENPGQGANEQSLKLFELINELLASGCGGNIQKLVRKEIIHWT